MVHRDLASNFDTLLDNTRNMSSLEEDDSLVGLCPFDDEEYPNTDVETEQVPPPDHQTTSTVAPEPHVLVRQLLQTELDNSNNNDDETTGLLSDYNSARSTVGDEHIELSVSDCSMLELIDCCDRAGTPMNFLDNFLRVLKKHMLLGFNIHKAPKRSTFMEHLRKNLPSPNAIPTTTKSGLMVLKYSFLDQLKDLLSTSYAQDVASCTVNQDPSLRWKKYIALEEEGLSEVACANWYQQTYDEKIGDNPYHVDKETGKKYTKFLMDIQLYNDKTGVGAIEGKYTLEPLMFSTGFLRRHIRQHSDAWRHLGFIPSYHQGFGEEEEKDAQKSLATFHEIIEVFLADLVYYQGHPPCLTLNLFGEAVDLCLILEVSFIIGDQLSQDHHCCRKKSNSGGASRVHRRCMASFFSMSSSTSFSDGTSPCTEVDKGVVDSLRLIIRSGEDTRTRSAIVEAEYPIEDNLPPQEVRQIRRNRDSLSTWLRTRAHVSREIFERVFGMYPVVNAWDKVSFGSNNNGIFRATLDDPLHFSSNGLFAYLNEVSFKGLVPSEARKVENFLREDCLNSRCSVKYDYPRPRLMPGFTNCTMITANEKVGQVFTLFFGLATKRMEDVYHESTIRQQQKYLDLDGSYHLSGLKKPPKSQGAQTNLPRTVDQYFFTDLKKKQKAEMNNSQMSSGYEIQRTQIGARKLVEGLDFLDLLFVLRLLPQLDKLQVEYLIQVVWFRCCRNDNRKPAARPSLTAVPDALYHGGSTTASQEEKLNLAKSLHRRFSKGRPGFSLIADQQVGTKVETKKTSNESDNESDDVSQVATPAIRARIKKHFLSKPKVKGTGDTCAFLTDVPGIRSVLEHSLILNAILQEHHQLSGFLQRDLNQLSNGIHKCLDVITKGIYRGDNSVDCATCKIHAHCHIVRDIAEYGSPSNYDATLGERGLKLWAKAPGRTARKCGEATFITQTASRISDRQILSKARRLVDSRVSLDDKSHTSSNVPMLLPWCFARISCHMFYDLEHNVAWYNEKGQASVDNPSCRDLLLPQIVKVLHSTHGSRGMVHIWKEGRISLGEGQGTHYVRAYHKFDAYSPYFDWVSLKDRNKEGDASYVPAKALLLYQFEGQAYCLCWRAKTAEATDQKYETNISARWRMSFRREDDRPLLISVPITDVQNTLWVYQHFPQTPPFPQCPTANKTRYTIEQAYTRYEWALNFLDQSRWHEIPHLGAMSDLLEEVYDVEKGHGWEETGQDVDMSDLREV